LQGLGEGQVTQDLPPHDDLDETICSAMSLFRLWRHPCRAFCKEFGLGGTAGIVCRWDEMQRTPPCVIEMPYYPSKRLICEGEAVESWD